MTLRKLVVMLSIFVIVMPSQCDAEFHLCFDQVGELATSVSFAHIHVNYPLEISQNDIQLLEHLWQEIEKAHDRINMKIKWHIYDFPKLRNRIRKTIEEIKIRQDNFNQFVNTKSISKRQILAGVVGIAGTLLGLLNTRQLDNLEKEISNVKSQNRYVLEELEHQKEYTHVLHDDISALNKTINVILNTLQTSSVTTQFIAAEQELEFLTSKMYRRIEMQNDLMQSSFDKRFPVAIANFSAISKVFDDLDKKADFQGFQLIPRNPIDLIQSETSFIIKNNELHLFLHVPMYRKGYTLRLYKYVDFPFPFNDTHALFIQPTHRFIGLAPDEHYRTITTDSLFQCKTHGKLFLCPHQGSLKIDLLDDCLGALYLKNLIAIKRACVFIIKEISDYVYQTHPTRFLLYTPKTLRIVTTCNNGTTFVHRRKGINDYQVDPGCIAKLPSHYLLPDISFDMFSSPLLIKSDWTLESLFDPFSIEQVMDAFASIAKFLPQGHPIPVSQIAKKISHDQEHSHSKPVVTSALVISLVALTAIGLSFLYLFCRYRTYIAADNHP